MKKILSFIIVVVALQGCLYEKNGSSLVDINGNPIDNNSNSTGTDTSTVSCGTNSTPSSVVCFNTQILPFFQSNCSQSGCHDAKTRAEGYDLTTLAGIKKGINTSNPTNSKLYKVIVDTGRERMPPPPAAPISQANKDMLLKWIKEGAKETKCDVVINAENPTFAAVIKPIIDNYCLGCHQSGNASGGVLLNSYANIKFVADNGVLLGSVKKITGYIAMPPSSKLSICEITAIENWVKAGALNN
ncbi:hypothetical protein EGI22_13345 [Lacihabitans sp. LS3-19]|uniref:c-type cytochrome domain-containing protein n=1 Tax=Lacihabitans sp. LS3-19 TaxID=2487335 RepID=UPI0020CF5D3F|nr:c-type cytochrome domain-containing protein [Lacihabitans sp. LS3-19]MCP9768898.1 hypothetical protein [Lacihabitans sp. LS3-19]